jgi:N-acetyl-anhydromuramyl-L-alanine amidase AmpD
MGLLRTALVSFLLVAALALPGLARAAASRVEAPSVEYLGPGPNFTVGHRKPTQIRFIVIHVTEGSYWGTISWLRNPLARASANFVVSRAGAIAELVPPRDIAWHAGNWRVNTLSVGIEHVGVTDDPAGFTTPEYRASARLAAFLARRALMPIDRQHIIGHADVPDPGDPGAGGGIDNHTDPGQYWRWNRYLKLVRGFAFPKAPHVGLAVESATVYPGQTLRGTVAVRARVRGPVRRVDFLVDGRLRSRDTAAPYAFRGGWHTRRLANGDHVVEIRAYGPRGAWTRERIPVRVRNLAFDLTLAGVGAGRPLAGLVHPSGVIRGAPARRVELWVDGKMVDHDTRSPFVFTWDTARTRNGGHALIVRAWSRDGRALRRSLRVTVLNPTPPEIVAGSLAEGQALQGVVAWTASVRGSVVRVEFVVDGAVRATAVAAPFAYAWDTSAESPGPHALVLRAVGVDGSTAEKTLTVSVTPPPVVTQPPAPPVP